MATLTPARIAITGVTVTLAAADALGDAVRPSPTTFIYVSNGHATDPRVVTLNDPRTALGVVGGPSGVVNSDLDLAVSIAALTKKFIAVPTRFLDPATGLASWSYDDEADLTLGAFYLPSGRGAIAATGAITAATQKITPSGLAPAYQNAAASQKLRPGARTFLHVRNAHNADHTLTLDDPTSVTPVGAVAFNPDVTVNIVQATSKFIGPIDARFSDPADGYRADPAWSATTSMSYASLSI